MLRLLWQPVAVIVHKCDLGTFLQINSSEYCIVSGEYTEWVTTWKGEQIAQDNGDVCLPQEKM